MKNLLLPLLLCTVLSVNAQQSKRFRLGVEYGMLGMMGKIDNRWEFRQIATRSHSHSGDVQVRGDGMIHHVGLKAEYSFLYDRFTIASGLRYIRINESIESSSASTSPLYMLYPSDRGIELFRIHGVNKSFGYVGIPLEADVVLLGYLRRWQFYVKGGIQAGIKVDGNTKINFVSKEMEKYEDEILTTLGQTPPNFFSNAYLAFGIRLFLRSGIGLSVEHNLPPLFLSKNNFSLLTSDTYPTPYLPFGMSFKISMPVHLFSNR